MNRHTSLPILMIAAIVAVFISTQFYMFRSLVGVPVNLLPGLIVYTALRSHITGLFIISAFTGLLTDSLSASPLGTSILPLMMTGFLVQLKKDWLLSSQVFAQFILGLLAGALIPLLDVTLVFMMLPESMNPPVLSGSFLWQWLALISTSGLMTPVVFKVLDAIRISLTSSPMQSYGRHKEISRDIDPNFFQ